MWAAHSVRYHQTGQTSAPALVCEMDLSDEVMELPAGSGLRLAIFTAQPASRSAEALALLASWTATCERQTTSDDAHRF